MEAAGNRPRRRIPHIGTYRRELPVSIERMYENTLDWEHLPYLHASSFARIECRESGPWGWRAWVWSRTHPDGAPFLLELMLDLDCRRWITRTVEGRGVGTEIWTHAFAMGDRRTDVVVDFFVPGIPEERITAMREFYLNLYAQLYDEDVSMMTLRQDRLETVRNVAGPLAPEDLTIGLLDEVHKRLPLLIEVGRTKIKVVEIRGELAAYPTVCPHRLGPLENGELTAGVVQCPWHGYRFDIRTGQCASGQHCRLSPMPTVHVDRKTSEVSIRFNR
ncbi:MAG: Rieske (2Fe-2S) protein [Candidatus Binataceae bacterium]